MEATTNSAKRLTMIALALLIISLAGNAIFFSNRSNLKTERDKALLKMDSVLSVKLLVDKELERTKNEIESCKGINAGLDKTLAEMDVRLTESRVQVDKLVKDNASVGSLRKKLKESQKFRDECEKKINDYIKENERLLAQNTSLNQSVNTLSQQLEALKEKLAAAKNVKAYDITVTNYKVSKKSSRPTVKAKRVNRIALTFNLMENPVADAGAKEVVIAVYDPQNKLVSSKTEKFTNKSANKEQAFSTSKSLDYANKELTATLNLDTEQKLIKGKYKAEIYVDGIYSNKKEFILK